MDFTNQLSFDDPIMQAEPDAEQLAADPLVQAIVLHEQAKQTVAEISRPFHDADVELIRVKRERDAISIQLKKVQAEMDSVMYNRHELSKKHNQAIAVMNAISESVTEMGGLPQGNNTFQTPQKRALFMSGDWKHFTNEAWEALR